MNLVTDQPGQPPVIWRWMHAQNKLPWSSDLRVIGLLRDDNTVAAGVGFNGWQDKSVWMHVAFDNEHGLTRQLWEAAFRYPFTDCGMEAVYGLTPKALDEALAMNERLGFRRVAETIDSVMFEMKADECLWLKGVRHGRQRQRTCSA